MGRLREKRYKKVYSVSINLKNIRVAVLIADKVDFKVY